MALLDLLMIKCPLPDQARVQVDSAFSEMPKRGLMWYLKCLSSLTSSCGATSGAKEHLEYQLLRDSQGR